MGDEYCKTGIWFTRVLKTRVRIRQEEIERNVLRRSDEILEANS